MAGAFWLHRAGYATITARAGAEPTPTTDATIAQGQLVTFNNSDQTGAARRDRRQERR